MNIIKKSLFALLFGLSLCCGLDAGKKEVTFHISMSLDNPLKKAIDTAVLDEDYIRLDDEQIRKVGLMKKAFNDVLEDKVDSNGQNPHLYLDSMAQKCIAIDIISQAIDNDDVKTIKSILLALSYKKSNIGTEKYDLQYIYTNIYLRELKLQKKERRKLFDSVNELKCIKKLGKCI